MNNFLKAFARPWLYKGLYFLKVKLAIFCISKEDLIVKFNYVNFQHKKILCIQIKDEYNVWHHPCHCKVYLEKVVERRGDYGF